MNPNDLTPPADLAGTALAPEDAGAGDQLAEQVPAHLLLSPEDYPDVSNYPIEDDTPVDSIFAEKQQRLLTEPLYSSWPGPGEGKTFLALTNVGLYYRLKTPPLVPDGMLGLDVSANAADLADREAQSYFIWVMGKPPDVVIEIVSDRHGGESTFKMHQYARIGIPYYVIFDPRQLQGEVLRGFARSGLTYEPIPVNFLPGIGLGLCL